MSVFVMHGLSYIMAIGILEMGNATIAGVIMSIVLTMFEGFIDLLGNIGAWCYTLWLGRAASNIELLQGYSVATSIPQICRDNPDLTGEDGCYQNQDGLVWKYILLTHFSHLRTSCSAFILAKIIILLYLL